MEKIIDESRIVSSGKKSLSEPAIDKLFITARWMKVSAFLGLFIAFLVIVSNLTEWSSLSSFAAPRVRRADPFNGVVYYLKSIIGLIGSGYLLAGSIQIGRYVRTHSHRSLRQGFRNQRIYFTILGVSCILYVILAIVSAVYGYLKMKHLSS